MPPSVIWRVPWFMVFVLGLISPPPVHAQRLDALWPTTTPVIGALGLQVVRVDTIRPVKSEGKAVTLSLAATLVPIAAGIAIWSAEQPDPLVGPMVMGGSLLIGPSVGHFYISRTGGLWLRLGIAAGATAAGLVAGTSTGGWEGLTVFVAIIGIGAGVVFVDGVYDIVRLPAAVRNYNAQR